MQFVRSNSTDREDLAQEIIYQLWKSGNGFDTGYKFSTRMYRVTLNVAISFYREKLTNPVIAVDGRHIDIAEPTENREDLEEDITNLQKFIAGLKELDRAIMLLYLEERTYKEIAEIIGISVRRPRMDIRQKSNGIHERDRDLQTGPGLIKKAGDPPVSNGLSGLHNLRPYIFSNLFLYQSTDNCRSCLVR